MRCDELLLIFLVPIIFVIELVQTCPTEMCVCKWKGGKQTVECGGKFLTRIPDGMDPGTQVLNFSGNSLTQLQNERFRQMELTNLQKIYLARNQIYRINERAFRGLSNLVELDLSENLLTNVPTDTFQDYTSLMRLTLSGNPIKELKTSAFRHLSYLTTLELRNCHIERVQDDAFAGLDHLEWLRLDGNGISRIEGGNILPTTLNGISLHDNKWACDCHLRDIYTWLNRFNTPQIEEPACASPDKLSKRVIKTLRPDELACVPDIEPTSLFLEVAEGRNISLQCKVRATPEANISWWFNGHLVPNESVSDHVFYDSSDVGDVRLTELYIFHVNTEDNGTFSCSAENSAGRAQANYTLRVIVKEEPIVEQVTFPYEYFLVVIAGAGCVVVIFVITVCILLCKCRNQQRGRRKERPSEKASITVEEKLNGSILLTENNPQDVMLYITNPVVSEPIVANSAVFMSPQRSFQEQNPDLINDTERSKSDSEKVVRFGTLPRGPQRADLYQVDVHLNPHFNGFPLVAAPVNYYRTLPHKKSQGAALRVGFNEAEFVANTRNSQTQTYAPDVRYTIQGYPLGGAFPSPPEGYKEISSTTMSCTTTTTTPWPSVLPGYTQIQQQSQIIPIQIQGTHFVNHNQIQKKCVSAQTSETDTIPEQPEDEMLAEETENGVKHLTGPLADSPDEGYVGDSQEGSDI